MKRILRVYFSLLGLATVWLPLAVSAHAAAAPPVAQGFNILTSPLPIKLSTSPGKTVQTELRFKNQGDQPEGIKIGLLRFGASGEDGQPDLYDITAKDNYASWVHFSYNEINAQPNVWNTVGVTINVPTNADLGYYLAVTFSPSNLDPTKGAANLNGTAATLLLLNVDTGNEKRLLTLAQFTSDKGLYEYLPANFSVKIRNNGNIYVSPSGNLFIFHNGKQIDNVVFNDSAGSVLPQTNRIFKLQWTNGFPLFKPRVVDGKAIVDKHNNPKQDLSYDFSQANKFRFGRYTAKLLVVYDNGKQDVPMEAEVNFWVLPWKVMLIVLAFVIIVGLGVFMVVRSLIRKARTGASKHRRGKDK